MRARSSGLPRPRILWQIADFADSLDLAACRCEFTGECLCQRRLACTVSTDETDLVAAIDSKRDPVHQQTRANAKFQVVHGQHSKCPVLWAR